jgi:transglutaminase-like putative cysteine protease
MLYWLLTGLTAAILPLLGDIPWWVILLLVGLFGWRIQYGRQQIGGLKKTTKFLIVVLSTALLFISVDKLFSVQGFVSLLSVACALKLMELQGPRDYLLLVFLGSFISASQLLFSSSVLSFAYTLVCLVIFHCCLLLANAQPKLIVTGTANSRIQQLKTHWVTYRKVAGLFLQALPIAVVLFIVMPRIGSIFKVPLNSDVAKTGVSDSLTAGDIARLNQDHSPAMRVTFASQTKPTNAELYWRGVVLSDFDGATWRRSEQQIKLLSRVKKAKLKQHIIENIEQSYQYQVMLERTGNTWLYALDSAVIDNSSVKQWQNYQFTRSNAILNRYQYKVSSSASYTDIEPLSESDYQANTSLSTHQFNAGEQNPKTRAYAAQLLAQYGKPEQRINAILKKFSDDFVYTLSPGKSAKDSPVDDFLFTKKRGYCEHFASSTAYLLRAAKIPARVVAGYQGGQWSSDNNYLLVTQAEAHAWVEVWLDAKGWVRLDPTAAVAPQRIEQGAVDFLPQLLTQQNLFNKLEQFSLIKKLRLNWDQVNYQWHRWVLNYNNSLQLDFVKRLLGGIDAWRIALFILLSVLLVLIPVLLRAYWMSGKTSKDALLNSIGRLEKKLAKSNLHRAKNESLSQYLHRATMQKNLNQRQLLAIEKLANSLLYNDNIKNFSAKLKELNMLVTNL